MVSLYTSIPIQEAITNAVDRIQNPILHLSKQDIIDLLTVTLNNMYFSFNGQVFRQKKGPPMGSSISGILAILFMDKLETIALSSHLSISPYWRYVDDICLQTTGEEMAVRSHHTMNSLHPKLKYEIEKPETTPNGLSLSLLDFKLKSPSPKTAEAPSSFTKNQPRSHYSYTTNQPYPRNQRSTSFAMSGNVSKIDAPHKRHP